MFHLAKVAAKEHKDCLSKLFAQKWQRRPDEEDGRPARGGG